MSVIDLSVLLPLPSSSVSLPLYSPVTSTGSLLTLFTAAPAARSARGAHGARGASAARVARLASARRHDYAQNRDTHCTEQYTLHHGAQSIGENALHSAPWRTPRLILAGIACAALGAVTIAARQAPPKPVTRAETLRGSITPEREWWDVLHYDLSVQFPARHAFDPRIERDHLQDGEGRQPHANRSTGAAQHHEDHARRNGPRVRARRQCLLGHIRARARGRRRRQDHDCLRRSSHRSEESAVGRRLSRGAATTSATGSSRRPARASARASGGRTRTPVTTSPTAACASTSRRPRTWWTCRTAG